MHRICDQLCQVFTAQRCEYDVLHYRASLTDRFELAHQWMGGADFVVAVGADQHQMPHIRPGKKIRDQIERCSVEPLQIVEE